MKPIADTRAETLNNLLDEQHALNRRMLLAIQTGDRPAQAELTKLLEDIAVRIQQMKAGRG
ncbi:MAG: hypothetical protein HFG00_04515 [Oscillibacter sp.]|nr:hypothetical protein [Oscillibacter sp.]MCI9120777.1 hypothetical protein [Oscillibacter sp.]